MKASLSDPNSPANLQKRYADLTAQINQGTPGMTAQYQRLLDEQRSLQGRMAAQGATGTGNGGVDEVADAKKKILDYTAGRGDAVMNDAMTNAALSRLDNVSAGYDAPFTQSVQNQMLAQSAGMNASAAGAQSEQLRQQAAGVGGSLADPSYQARLRQVNAQRQSANANARGQIATTAQLQNFGARQTGTNSLLAGRTGQMGMANSQYNQAAGYLNQTQQDAGHQSGVQMPSTVYNFSGGQPMQMPQTPQIQYQQYQPQQPQVAQPMAGTQQSVGQYANQLVNTMVPSIMRSGTPYQAPYSNSPLPSIRPQGPAQPYTF